MFPKSGDSLNTNESAMRNYAMTTAWNPMAATLNTVPSTAQ